MKTSIQEVTLLRSIHAFVFICLALSSDKKRSVSIILYNPTELSHAGFVIRTKRIMITAMLCVFVSGYMLIAAEHRIGINKTAIALTLGISLWTMYIFAGPSLIVSADPGTFHDFISRHPEYDNLSLFRQAQKYVTGFQMIEQLGNISEILFYLLGAMTIVEAIDLHHGFSVITEKIGTRNKKKLLWIVALLTFFMSSVLDNMTSAIVMTLMTQKLLTKQRERWIFGSLIIIAANAGGAWTPIGDITTIMLWINGNITSGGIMKSLFLPSLASLLVPVWIGTFALHGKTETTGVSTETAVSPPPDRWLRNRILPAGLLCLLSVPVFKSLTDLPPFAGIMLTLGLFWSYTDFLYKQHAGNNRKQFFRISDVLLKVDFSTLLFFLGILMSVAALNAIGILRQLAEILNARVHNIYAISLLIGLLSSVVDNVPLVAAAMGMYSPVNAIPHPLTPEGAYLLNFVRDGEFWDLTAYCAGTGGSILIIGSAAGVVVMGLEKINFIWYLKHISRLALSGFLAGAGTYRLLSILFRHASA